MSIALVLSGGATRGDFEAGAVKFLYEVGIRPDIICSTSVGSVNAIKLAEGEGAPTQGLGGLLNIWQNQINRFEDVYGWEDWLSQINSDIANIFKSVFLSDFTLPSSSGSGSSGSNGSWGDLAALWNDLSDASSTLKEAAAGPALFDALNKLQQADGFINLNPLQGLLQKNVNEQLVVQWANAVPGRALRVAMVSLATGRLRFMTETGEVLEQDLKTVLMVPSQQDPCASLRAALENLVESRNASIAQDIHDGKKPSQDPEILQINLEIEQARQQLENCLKAHPSTGLVPVKISLVTGAMASSLQPSIMPAQNIGGDWYVDAGIRSVLPVKAALDQGATTIWAVEASPRGLPPWTPKPTLLDVAARAIAGILLDNVTVSDELAATGHDVKFIFPNVTVHEPLEVDPGLIQISIDYGYMRAFDVFHGTSEQFQAMADQITITRRDTWHSERYAFSVQPGYPPDTVNSAFALIRAGKRRSGRLAHARTLLVGGGTVGIDTVNLPWEKHGDITPLPGTPWDAFPWEAGHSVPAMTPYAADSPAASVVTWGSNRLDIFVLGTQGQMYHKAWDGGQPSQINWEPMGDLVHPTYVSAPTATTWGNGRLDAFAVGSDRVLYHKPWIGGMQFGWEPLEGVWCSGNPVALSWGNNRLDVFVLGSNTQLFHNALNGSTWAGWESLGGALITMPAVTAWGNNRLDVFALGTDEQMYHKYWDGSKWGPSPTDWESLGGIFTSAPAVTSWGSNRLDIFGVGTDGQLYHKAFNGAWQPSQTGWDALGQQVLTALPN